MRNRTKCNHVWIDYYDPVEDAACYNDGFNYVPIDEVCTSCGKTRRKKGYRPSGVAPWWFGLFFPFIAFGMLLALFLAPLIILIMAVINAVYVSLYLRIRRSLKTLGNLE